MLEQTIASEPIRVELLGGHTNTWLIVAPLLSALIAALLTWFANWKMEGRRLEREDAAEIRRRDEARQQRETEIRQAARMIWSELLGAVSALESILEVGKIPPLSSPNRELLTDVEWQKFGPVIALGETEMWQPIAATYNGLRTLNVLVLSEPMIGHSIADIPKLKSNIELQIRSMKQTYEHVREMTGWDGFKVIPHDAPTPSFDSHDAG